MHIAAEEEEEVRARVGVRLGVPTYCPMGIWGRVRVRVRVSNAHGSGLGSGQRDIDIDIYIGIDRCYST